jgi:hypothetical protein
MDFHNPDNRGPSSFVDLIGHMAMKHDEAGCTVSTCDCKLRYQKGELTNKKLVWQGRGSIILVVVGVAGSHFCSRHAYFAAAHFLQLLTETKLKIKFFLGPIEQSNRRATREEKKVS